MRFFAPKYFARLSRDCLATVLRRSCECPEPVAAKFRQIYNAKFSGHSCECRASVERRSRDSLEKTCEHLATIWRENKTKRQSYECCATLSRMSRDCRTNENKLHSRKSHFCSNHNLMNGTLKPPCFSLSRFAPARIGRYTVIDRGTVWQAVCTISRET